ncbi:peptidase family M1, partial [Teladorsagia circumcincta]
DITGDWIISKFKTTPPMSSYLLAVIVSEFDFIEGNTASGVRFRIWSRPEAKNMTQYALRAGIKCLEAYEKFFDIKFPLEKQDMVAVPDFSLGAMENWGLIIYRENALLYDEKYYAPLNKERVATVVVHELAHQWFGDLVTLKWWDNLWLNEGFASFVQYIGVNVITDDKFKMEDYFLVEAFAQGMEADAVASSHPLSFRVDKVPEVAEAFDDVTYRKGAAVLTMLQALIGKDNFWKAITKAVIDACCHFGSKECIETYRELFVKQVSRKCKQGHKASECVKVAAPLRAMVYCYGVKEGGDEAFDK